MVEDFYDLEPAPGGEDRQTNCFEEGQEIEAREPNPEVESGSEPSDKPEPADQLQNFWPVPYVPSGNPMVRAEIGAYQLQALMLLKATRTRQEPELPMFRLPRPETQGQKTKAGEPRPENQSQKVMASESSPASRSQDVKAREPRQDTQGQRDQAAQGQGDRDKESNQGHRQKAETSRPENRGQRVDTEPDTQPETKPRPEPVSEPTPGEPRPERPDNPRPSSQG